jgi:lipoprotein-anchoring transpeptidase ErfK/SrfK
MRLSPSFPHILTLLAAPLLVAALAVSARAETYPKAGPSLAPAAPTAQSGAKTAENNAQAAPNPSAESKPAAEAPDAAASSSNSDSQAPAANAGPPKSSVLVNIDKSTQEMTVFVDGIEQYRWPVSTGQRGYSTPSGTYQARSMNKIWYSKQWDNAPMPHAIFFTKDGHAIHGTLEEKRLGNAASHGCVRLSQKNAATLYGLVEKNGLENTEVVLVGTTPGGEAKVANQGSRKSLQGYPPPWFDPGMGAPYYGQPAPQQRRRGLFGRWFQPDVQGYYAPPPRYYQRRGY